MACRGRGQQPEPETTLTAFTERTCPAFCFWQVSSLVYSHSEAPPTVPCVYVGDSEG